MLQLDVWNKLKALEKKVTSLSNVVCCLAKKSELLQFVQTATQTIANTVAESSLLGIGVGSLTIPSNTLKEGSVIKLDFWGEHSATNSPNITVNFKLNGVTMGTTGQYATDDDTLDLFRIEVSLVCYSAGVSGSFWVQGWIIEGGGGSYHPIVTNSPVTIDTAIPQTVDLTFQWDVADPLNSITSTNVTVEIQ